jgi:DNA-binding LytR/AlgR family response regulator
VRLSKIRYLEANGDYVRMFIDDGSSNLARLSLSTLERLWSDAGFVRVHRSFLVASSAVVKVTSISPASYQVTLDDGTELPMSRRYYAKLRKKASARLPEKSPGIRRVADRFCETVEYGAAG